MPLNPGVTTETKTVDQNYANRLEHLIQEARGLYEKGTHVSGIPLDQRFVPSPFLGKGEPGEAANRARDMGMMGNADYLPHLQTAAQLNNYATTPFAPQAGSYMNPYQQQVSNRIAEMGNRNLTENILPQLEAKFVRMGQHGSKRHAQLAANAARDIQSEISAQQAQALYQGYGQAAEMFNAEKARQLEASRVAAALAQSTQAGRMTDVEAFLRQAELERMLEQQQKDYQFWQEVQRQQHPYEQLERLNAILHGLPYSTTTRYDTPSGSRSMHSGDFGTIAAGIGANLATKGIGNALASKFPNLFG